MYIGENEGAKFWLQVLTDLSNRGVSDIFIACIDNLQGFAEAIESIFPQAEVQLLCVVHQIRNSHKYLSHKDVKAFMKDLQWRVSRHHQGIGRASPRSTLSQLGVPGIPRS